MPVREEHYKDALYHLSCLKSLIHEPYAKGIVEMVDKLHRFDFETQKRKGKLDEITG